MFTVYLLQWLVEYVMERDMVMSSDELYSYWDHINKIMEYFDKRGCPYCGMKDWTNFEMATGYGSHYSDSTIGCNNRNCTFIIGMRSGKASLEEHYSVIERKADAWFHHIQSEYLSSARRAQRLMEILLMYLKAHKVS